MPGGGGMVPSPRLDPARTEVLTRRATQATLQLRVASLLRSGGASGAHPLACQGRLLYRPLDLAMPHFRGGPFRVSSAYDLPMEINLDLRLVDAQFDESNVALDAENNVSLVLDLTGNVDADWITAFDQSAPSEVPWKLEDAHTLSFGPIPVRDVAGHLGALRTQINKTNESVKLGRHRQAMAEHLEAEERARAYKQAIDALSGLFGRRLSTTEWSSSQAA